MKKKIYHLGSCSTNQKIINEIGINNLDFEIQDIKQEKITALQIDKMKKMAGSYEALFSRRALKYKAFGLSNKKISEEQYRQYILDEYTFLKRPVVIIGDKIFIGSEKKTIELLKKTIQQY